MIDKVPRDVGLEATSNTPGASTDPTSIGRRALSGTIANYVGQFVTLAAGFFLTPFILHQVGPAQFGLWVLIGSIVTNCTMLDFGVRGTVVKYVAEYRSRGDLAQARTLIATALCFYLLLGTVAAALSLALARLIPALFQIPEAERSTAVWLALLSGLGMGVFLPSLMPSAVLHGLQRFDLANLITVAGTLLNALATVTVLLLGGGVLGVAAVVIPTTLLMQVPSIWLVNRTAPELHFGWRGAKTSAVRTVVSFSSSLFLQQLSGRLQTKTDEIVIGLFLPVSAVTPYALARRLSEMVSLLCEQSTKVLMPLASQLDAGGEQHRLRALYLASSRLTLALATLAGTALMLLAGPLLSVWVGPAYADSAYLVTVLTAANVLWVSLLPANSILQGSARHRPLAVAGAVTAIANLALSIILVRTVGLVGVALGTLIPTAVETFSFVLPYAMRTIGVSIGRIVTDVWMPALLPAIPMALTLYGFQQTFGFESLPALLVATLAGAMAYVMTYLVVGTRGEERRAYCTAVSRIHVWMRGRRSH